MIKVKQTILHNPDKGNIGNCLQACIASVLEMDIGDVPHFASHRGSGWFDRMNQWLLKRGLYLLVINGWDGDFMPHGYSIACGLSPRQVRHSCIAYNGVVVFDPHPDGTGLLSIDSYYLFVSAQETPHDNNPT